MKPKFRSLIAAFAPLQRNSLIICASLCAVTAAHADQTWSGNNSATWNDAGNWTSAVPNSSDSVIFDSSSALNLDTTLDANFSIYGISVSDPVGPVSISGPTSVTAEAVTADNATDVFTYDVAPAVPLANGNMASVAAATLPAGLAARVQYYVVNATATTFQLSDVAGGSPIDITDDGVTVTVTGGPALSIDGGGIDMSGAAQPVTISTPVTMLADQTWANATDLTFNGAMSDGVFSNFYSLTKAGAGTLTLNGQSTYTGNTNVTEGALFLGINDAIGSPAAVILSDATELSVPTYLIPGAGGSLLVDGYSSATYTIRGPGGYNNNIGAVDSGAELNVNLNFNNNITTFQGSWQSTALLWNLNVTTQPGTQSRVRLRPNGGGFDTTSFAQTDVNLDNTEFYVTTYSGGATVLLGSLAGTADAELSGGDAGGAATWSIGRVDGPDTIFSGWVSDNGVRAANIIKTDDSQLTIGGNCTNTGTWDIVDGTIQFGEGGATGAPGTGPILVDSDGIGGGQLVFNRTGSFTVAGVVSGVGPITLGGGADATFSNVNSSFTGILTANGGSITASALADGGVNSSIGASTSDAANVILNGATLGYTGALTSTDRNFTIGMDGGGFGASGSGAVTFSSAAPLVLDGFDTARTLAFSGSSTAANTFTPQIDDNGTGATSLIKTGAGNWALAGANTYSGGTTVTEGTLTLSNLSDSATGTGAISVQTGGALAGTGSASGTATIDSGAALVPGSNGVGTLAVGGLTLESGSTTDFELQPGGPNDLVVTTGLNGLTINGGAINLYQPGTTIPVTAAGTYNLFQYSGAIGGSIGNLVLTEPVGTDYVLGFDGTHVTVTVSAELLPNTWSSVGGGNWSTPGNWTTGVPGGTGVIVNFLSAATSPSTITLDGSRTAGGFLFDNVFSYTIAPGSGVLTLDNSALPADVSVGTGDHSINVDVSLVAGMNVDTEVATSLTFGGAVSGTGGIAKSGDGLLVLNGSNLFAGGVTINAGSVQVGANSALGTDGLAFAANSSLVLGAPGLVLANAVSIATGVNGTVNTNGNNATLSNVISGDGVLVKSGAGVLSLTNTNTYAGGTVMNGGLIEFANAGNLGSGALSFNGGGLRWATGNTLDPSTLTTDFLAGGGIFDTNGNDVAVAGNVGGTGLGRLTKQGAGLMTLAAGQTFQGGVSILGGTLAIDNVTALGTIPGAATPGNLVINNGTLQTTGTQTISGNRGVTLGGSAIISKVSSADTVTIGGVIAGSGSLTLAGGGIWYLNQVNSYSGGTILVGTETHLASGATAGTGLITLSNTALIMEGSDSPTFTLANNVDVPAGTTSSIRLPGRVNINGVFTGATDSTINLDVRYVRDAVNGNWSNFFGQINVTATQTGNGEFRINNGNGFGNAKLSIGAGVNMSQIFNPPSGSGTQTIQNIGELSGTVGAYLGGNPVSGRFVNWTIGGLNTNSIYNGVIGNSSGAARITKVGTGTLTLTGVNTYTGSTTVNGGSLALGASGSIDASTDLILGAAGVLDTTAKASFAIPATQTVTFNVTGAGSGASGRINASGQILDISNVVVNFTVGDPLDDAVYILADYGTLNGSGTAVVTPPAGYTVDFTYNSGTQIALVATAGGEYTTWADSYLPADVSNPAGDNDNDGLTNQQEFAFGLDPTSGSSVNPIIAQLDKTAGTFTYQRRATTGLTYRILVSTDLVSWPEDEGATASQAAGTVDGNGNQNVVVTLSGAPLAETKFFVRVAAD